MKRLFLFVLPLLTLFACQETLNPDGCKAVVRDSERYQNESSDAFQLIDAALEGDCLVITVSYAGGCKEVDFSLLAIEGETFSLPPQIPMRLVLDDNDDCEALVTKELHFDLRSLQGAGGTGLHMLDLAGLSEMIEYTY